MPRNPDKKPCPYPACRAWAMRDRDYCRSHLDHVLGPRRAGAPIGNVNALKSGKYARPIPSKDIDELASLLLLNPEQFVYHIAQTAKSIHGRSDDALKSTMLFGRLLSNVLSRMAEITYESEFEEALQRLPVDRRPGFKKVVSKHSRRFTPIKRLIYLRTMVEKIFENKQLAEH